MSHDKREKKTCSGFPEKSGSCQQPATATVFGARQQVCEAHAKQAETNNLHVKRYAVKK